MERWAAVVAVVEGVVREGLEVVAVGFHAHGAEGVEGGYDLVAGVVEDPVTIHQRASALVLAHWGWRGKWWYRIR